MHTTRTVRVLAAGVAVAFTLTACGGGGGTGGQPANGPRLLKQGEIVIAMSGEFQPFSYFENNQLVGFDRDIAQALADEMKLTLKTEIGPFDTLIQGVKSKRYDALVASTTPTEERKKAVDFSDPYYKSGAQIFVKTDRQCTSAQDLKDPVIGVASGTTYEKYLKDHKLAKEIRGFSSDVTALQDTDAGRLDAAITDRNVGLYQIEKAKRSLKPCGEPLFVEEPAVAVDKNNPLLGEVNKSLAAIKQNGKYAEISNKWFGQDISK